MISETTLGRTASQLLALATSSRLASTPSAPHAWIHGPLICAAAGGLPETTRDFSTDIAESPPPPVTTKSFQLWPLDCSVAFSAAAALASPPEVQ